MMAEIPGLPDTLDQTFKDYVLFQDFSLGHTHLDPAGPGLAILMVAQQVRELRLSLERKIDALIAALPGAGHVPPGHP